MGVSFSELSGIFHPVGLGYLHHSAHIIFIQLGIETRFWRRMPYVVCHVVFITEATHLCNSPSFTLRVEEYPIMNKKYNSIRTFLHKSFFKGNWLANPASHCNALDLQNLLKGPH